MEETCAIRNSSRKPSPKFRTMNQPAEMGIIPARGIPVLRMTDCPNQSADFFRIITPREIPEEAPQTSAFNM